VIDPNTTSDHLSYFPDLFPTFTEVAGIGDEYDVDGMSLLPALRGENASQHEYLYWEFPAYGGQQAIRYGKWKGVRKTLFKDPGAAIELYDLETDIAESNDLASEHPEIVLLLDSLMKAAHIPSETFPFEALDNN
jgi:arylsulfatase